LFDALSRSEYLSHSVVLSQVNGDGEIDFEEFQALMRLRMGDDGEDAELKLKDIFDVFDADGSGAIDKDEMRMLMKKLAQSLTEDEISAIMEGESVCVALSRVSCGQFFFLLQFVWLDLYCTVRLFSIKVAFSHTVSRVTRKELDVDGDGEISFEEFKALMVE
jgi:Ca2+-binding EF-hand superfamily protein